MSGLMSGDGNERLPVGLAPRRSSTLPVEVLTWRGLATYYVLFSLHLETRRVTLAGITQHPTEEWMVQMARRAVDDIDGTLLPIRFVQHDRDSKFCTSFQDTLRSAGIQPVSLPARSPNRLGGLHHRYERIAAQQLLSGSIIGEGQVSCYRLTIPGSAIR